MPHLTPMPLANSDTESGRPTAACTPPKHAPVLLTENQVAFSTAAATPAPTTRLRPLYPHRELAYLEAARMSRAMDRL